MVESIQSEEEKEKRNEKSKDRSRKLWESIKQPNIYIVGVSGGGDREKGAESLFKEIITEKFPNLGREMDILIHEAYEFPQRFV